MHKVEEGTLTGSDAIEWSLNCLGAPREPYPDKVHTQNQECKVAYQTDNGSEMSVCTYYVEGRCSMHPVVTPVGDNLWNNLYYDMAGATLRSLFHRRLG